MEYDFSALSDVDFEKLVATLIKKQPRIAELYAEGRDNGVDAVVRDIPKDAFIQAKHYAKSRYSNLKKVIKDDEVPKIKTLKTSCYVLATSFDLSRSQAEELRDLIKGIVKNVVILGRTSISNLLDNDPETLKSAVKLWALNLEVIKKVLQPANMNAVLDLKSRWQNQNNVFVETTDVNKVLQSLENNHVAIIAGNPGVGKTTLAEYICLLYLKDGYDVHIFEGEFSRQDYDMSDSDKKIIFYFDDFLGSCYYNCMSGKQDSEIVGFLRRISHEKNKRFILTSRSNIIQKATIYSDLYHEYGLDKKAYIVNVGSYSWYTKASILFNHIRNAGIEHAEIEAILQNKMYWRIIRHRNFNPRLISFITQIDNYRNSEKSSYSEFIMDSLENPKAIWDKCFTKQLNNSQRLLVQLVVANQGSIRENVLKSTYQRALDLMKITAPEQEKNDFDYVLGVCLKSLLKKEIEKTTRETKSFIRVFNPSVSDYVLPIILEKDLILNLCDSLRTYHSVCVIESNKDVFDEVNDMYMFLLNKYSHDEWCDAKIHLIYLLGFDCGFVPDLINHLQNNKKLIVGLAKRDVYSIVQENLNKYDFSDFILQCGDFFCEDYQDFGGILDGYEKTSFVRKDVVEYLQKKIVFFLSIEIEELVKFNDDFDDCATTEEIDDLLDKILSGIKKAFPYLSDAEIDGLRLSVNTDRLYEEKEQNLYEEDDKDRRDEYLNEMKQIDKMFDNLASNPFG